MSDFDALDPDLVQAVLARAVAALGDDLEERRAAIRAGSAPPSAVMRILPGGRLMFEWGGRELVIVPRTVITARQPGAS